jgi:uncharacterized protein (DUF1697 family)
MPRSERVGSTLRTYVALLRGINLGGHNKVSMSDLRVLFASLGAEDVATYVQSGNIIFNSIDGPGELIRAIEKRISRDLGLSVRVLLRTPGQLAKVLAANPFSDGGPELTKLHVTFLADKPDRARLSSLDPERAEPDEFRVVREEIFLYCPNGYGRSKLTNAYFERQLGVAATTRNWKTVTKLAELASAAAPSGTRR